MAAVDKRVANIILDGAIRPTLHKMKLWSESAERLVWVTGAQESSYVHDRQLGGGPAVGYFQCERPTYLDYFQNFLKFDEDLKSFVDSCRWTNEGDGFNELEVNHIYAAALCRIHYRRIKEPLPPANDGPAHARYWKKYYNTHLGKGKEAEFLRCWKTLGLP